MNEEEKRNLENNIEEKFKNMKEKDVLNNLTYAECLFILTPENKYGDDIKELSLLKLCEIIEKQQKECIFREDGAEEGLWHCSNCHDEWLFYEGTPEDNELKYCPHCGAKVIKYESYIEGQIEIANKMEEDYLKERKRK